MAEEEVEDFEVINFGKCFKSSRKKLYSELREEKNLRKVVDLFYSFLTTAVKLIEKMPEAKIMMQSSYSDDCLHHYNIKILNLLNL